MQVIIPNHAVMRDLLICIWPESDFMIIDSHVHVGFDRGGASQSMRRLRKNMRAYGIDKSVVFPFDEKYDLVKASIELLKQKNPSTIPFLRFDPKKMSPERLEELLSRGFSGVKLHPRAQNFDPMERRYYGLYRKIEDSGKPLLMHTRKSLPFSPKPLKVNGRYSDPDRIVKLAKLFPNLNMIIAHFANLSRYAIEAIGREDNLYMETSIFGTTFVVRMMVDRLGPDKIIFGSDAPYSDQEIEMLKIRKADINNYSKRKMLSGNITSLL